MASNEQSQQQQKERNNNRKSVGFTPSASSNNSKDEQPNPSLTITSASSSAFIPPPSVTTTEVQPDTGLLVGYQGPFNSQGKRHGGSGTCVYPDGCVYEGEWRHNERHGNGTCYFPSGNIYIGQWNQGQIDGKGVMFYVNGDFFDGMWKSGKCHGEGVFYTEKHATHGVWENGDRVSGKAVSITGSGPGHLVVSNPSTSNSPSTTPAAAFLRLKAVGCAVKSVQNFLFANTSTTMERSVRSSSSNTTPISPSSSPADKRGSLRQQQQGQRGNEPISPNRGLNSTAVYVGGTAGSESPPPQDGEAESNRRGGSILPGGSLSPSRAGGGGGAPTDQSQQQGGQLTANSISKAAAAATTRELLFAVAGPTYNTTFDLAKFMKTFCMFLFPFFSLPHFRFCPWRMTSLDMEREYVVSGAALHIDFEVPKWSLYVSMFSVIATILTYVFGDQTLRTDVYSRPIFANLTNGTSVVIGEAGNEITDKTLIARIDLVAPLVGLILFAAMNAGYHSVIRIAHALERLDRHQFPVLAAFAANSVDSQSDVCIYTWDEQGNGKVTNAHYHYRWLLFSFCIGLGAAFMSPIHRACVNIQPFGSTSEGNEQATVVFSFLGVFFAVMGVSYYILKITDMERQVRSQMNALSRAAYLRGQSILRPTDIRQARFNYDAPVLPHLLTEGFVGWYVTRCFILYACTCSNHNARSIAMSGFYLFFILMCVVAVGDLLYALINGFVQGTGSYWSSAHLLGLYLSMVWGMLVLRHLYIGTAIERERKKHLYLVDVAALYHQCFDMPAYTMMLGDAAANVVGSNMNNNSKGGTTTNIGGTSSSSVSVVVAGKEAPEAVTTTAIDADQQLGGSNNNNNTTSGTSAATTAENAIGVANQSSSSSSQQQQQQTVAAGSQNYYNPHSGSYYSGGGGGGSGGGYPSSSSSMIMSGGIVANASVNIITTCRQMILLHDHRPHIFQLEVSPHMLLVTCVVILMAAGSLMFQLGQFLHYGTSG